MSIENATPVVDEVTKEAEDKSAAIFFEDDEEITLRDGKTYKIPPLSLKNARKFIANLKVINIDVVLMNFLTTEDDAADEERIDRLFDVLLLGFGNYPHVTKEYLDDYVDLELARKIIEYMIGLNGLKK